MPIEVERLEDWLGQDVLDPSDEKAGKLDEVFLDGDEPVLAEVKAGGLRRKTRLVPLDGATVGRAHVRVAYAAKRIADAPEGLGEGAPDEAYLRTVGSHYGLNWSGGTLEGSKPRAARLAAADAAEARARELEDEARRQAEQSEQAGRASEDAAAARERAAADAEAARAEAERARGAR
jgi:PRC-barrel domain